MADSVETRDAVWERFATGESPVTIADSERGFNAAWDAAMAAAANLSCPACYRLGVTAAEEDRKRVEELHVEQQARTLGALMEAEDRARALVDVLRDLRVFAAVAARSALPLSAAFAREVADRADRALHPVEEKGRTDGGA